MHASTSLSQRPSSLTCCRRSSLSPATVLSDSRRHALRIDLRAAVHLLPQSALALLRAHSVLLRSNFHWRRASIKSATLALFRFQPNVFEMVHRSFCPAVKILAVPHCFYVKPQTMSTPCLYEMPSSAQVRLSMSRASSGHVAHVQAGDFWLVRPQAYSFRPGSEGVFGSIAFELAASFVADGSSSLHRRQP